MRIVILAGAAIIAMLFMATLASAAPPVDLHCPDGGTKTEAIETELNDLIPEAGVLVCVKAGTGNTGVVTADGETTLQGLLFAAGIVDGSGEQGRDVSYFVVYEATQSTDPSSTVEPTPDPTAVVASLPDTAVESQKLSGAFFLVLASLLLFGIGLYLVADSLSNRR